MKNDKEDEKLRKEYQALDLKIGTHIRIRDDLAYKSTDLKTGKKLLEMAERKLEIGRKINNQVIWRDLVDCYDAMKHLVEVHQQRNMEMKRKFDKWMVEMTKMAPCFNGNVKM